MQRKHTGLRGPISRRAIPKMRLDEALERMATAPRTHRLWIAERWPWTPGTEAALSDARPAWAVVSMALETIADLEHGDPIVMVAELMRRYDPWPEASRAPSIVTTRSSAS